MSDPTHEEEFPLPGGPKRNLRSSEVRPKSSLLFACAGVFLLCLLSGSWIYRVVGAPNLPRSYRILELADENGYRLVHPKSINNPGYVVGEGIKTHAQSADRGPAKVGLIVFPDGKLRPIPWVWDPVNISDGLLIDGYTGASPPVSYRTLLERGKPLEVGGEWTKLDGFKGFVATNNRNETLMRHEDEYFLVNPGGDYHLLSPTEMFSASGEPQNFVFSDMNDSQILVGRMRIETEVFRPAIWSETHGHEVLRDFELDSSEFIAINNRGVCVGSARQKRTDSIYLWSLADGLVSFSKFENQAVWPFDLNDHGQVVGGSSFETEDPGFFRKTVRSLSLLQKIYGKSISYLPIGWRRRFQLNASPRHITDAFIWENDRFYDLNAALPFFSEWDRLLYATDINNRGQIIGVGLIDGEERGFLMTPVEEGG